MVKFAGNEFAKPRPLNKDEIEGVVEDFAESAFWCWKAGADGVQIHCAHGYLLAQFISPTTNKRTDEYGGSLENRSRIVFEIIDKIREKVLDKTFSVSVKLKSVEFQDGESPPRISRTSASSLRSMKWTLWIFLVVHSRPEPSSTRKNRPYVTLNNPFHR
jgi:2,4-dienoyl-CoA reductase-like NADH-dependent reductase (Old Yellow Enzyme family)